MKVLAISDFYIPRDIMRSGLSSLEEKGIEIEVRSWEQSSLEELQKINLAVEQEGPQAVELPQALSRDLENFEVIVVQFAPIPREAIEAARNLKAISVLRGGTENVDLDYAASKGIAVLNTPGRNARAVAECALGMILCEVRNIARAHAALTAHGQWRRDFPNSSETPELNGKTVGLIGLGAVGTLLAGYLRAMGSRVIAYDPFLSSPPEAVELVKLDSLLKQSDIVSLHARLTAENQQMIGSRELALMKNSAVLVNTARAGLIDQNALVDALQNQRIMGAALDVFTEEPLAKDHPLTHLPNVTLTSHLAGSTIDSFRNSPRLAAEHLMRMLDGKGPLPIVNNVELYKTNR